MPPFLATGSPRVSAKFCLFLFVSLVHDPLNSCLAPQDNRTCALEWSHRFLRGFELLNGGCAESVEVTDVVCFSGGQPHV